MSTIKAIDKVTIHHITSGQVLIDLRTAVKELLENSIDAGATNIEVRFKQYGLSGLEVVDNGSGIAPENHEGIALKHHTSKLSSFTDLDSVSTFGFRGEALSSLCALCGGATVTTATASMEPKATCLVVDTNGKVIKQSSVARPRGTTVSLTKLFSSLAVRRKEFERNIKREFGKALTLLTAYALGPCASGIGIRLTVSNQPDKGQKTTPIKTLGAPSFRSSMTALWGNKADENIVDMNFSFEVERERIKRLQSQDLGSIPIRVQGLISKFGVGCGRSGQDRQFLYLNGRPCDLPQIAKAFNDVYRTFNANQAPFILADFILPTDTYDVNISPDKRSIFLHSEANLIAELKTALEAHFSPSRSTYSLGESQPKPKLTQSLLTQNKNPNTSTSSQPLSEPVIEEGEPDIIPTRITTPVQPASREHSASPPSSPHDTTPAADSSSARFMPSPRQIISASNNIAADSVSAKSRRPVEGRMVSSDDMVIDSSQTAWGRQLGIISPTKPTVRPGSPLSGDAETSDEAVRQPKKRKQDDTAEADMDDVEEETFRASTKTSDTRVIKPASTSASASSKKSVPKKVDSRNSLRSQLANFAAPGTQRQLSTPAIKRLVSEVPEGFEDEDVDEEMDELDEDSPPREKKIVSLDFCPPSAEKDSPEVSSPISETLRHDRPETLEDRQSLFLEDDEEEDPNSILSQAKATSSITPSTGSSRDPINRPEIIRTERAGADIVVHFNIDNVQTLWNLKITGSGSVSGDDIGGEVGAKKSAAPVPVEASILNVEDGENAERALSRVINKTDFNDMDVIGQFNLGFIIARRRTGTSDDEVEEKMDDLFIVDQHAADEKYNFETLQATTKIEAQKLVRPRPLELPAADEMLVIENLEVLRQSGFEIVVDEDVSETHGRLKLSAMPISKNTVFDVKDLEEILHLMRNRPTGQIIRCSKARAMFAMRACRKSVMVGMPLNSSQMTSVVRHMGTMDQPWNCPHGRPTMRHLCDIRSSGVRPKDKIDWSML